MGTLEPDGEDAGGRLLRGEKGRSYRLCQNYTRAQRLQLGRPRRRPEPLCRSCRLTRVIPDLSQPGTREPGHALEVAKRRLVYSLLGLDLPLASKAEDPERGLAFEFLADSEPGTPARPRA